MKRRDFITTSAVGTAGVLTSSVIAKENTRETQFKLKNNINHSVCRWCYSKIPMETFLENLNELGIKAMDLTGPEDWPLMKKYDIHASMCWGAEISLTEGWNDPKHHPTLIKNYTEMIPKVAEAGYTNLICFSGNRNGISDEKGLQNCAEGLKHIIPLAEKHGVIIQMELLNSKVDHTDYMCDHTEWGYHTGGNPGRNEINDTQELLYPAIMKAILATGFKGHVAQEYIPTWDDKIASLKDGILRCDV